jgi:drug/metabolite transporter (DMT)-like permease
VKLAVQVLMLSVLTNTAAQLSLKHGLRGLHVADSSRTATKGWLLARLVKNPFILLWVGLLVPSMLLWLKAISMVELSFAYPFMSLNIVFISAGSIFFLKERVSAQHRLGILFIVLGLTLSSIS